MTPMQQHYENTIAIQLVQLKAWSVIFQVRHFHALQFGPSFSGPSIFQVAHLQLRSLIFVHTARKSEN